MVQTRPRLSTSELPDRQQRLSNADDIAIAQSCLLTANAIYKQTIFAVKICDLNGSC